MKQGTTLQQLAAELDRQVHARRDFLADPTQVEAEVVEAGTKEVPITNSRGRPTGETKTVVQNDLVIRGLSSDDNGGLRLTGLAERQLASFTDIPAQYWDRMKAQAPELLQQSVQTWLRQRAGKRRMFRTLDGKVRAIMSNSYRPLDNYELAEAVLPVFQSIGAEVRSSALTESRMYLKVTLPEQQVRSFTSLRGEEIIEGGMTISNSEVGAGSLWVELFARMLICINGMIGDKVLRRTHLGRAQQGENIEELLSARTKGLEDAAFWHRVRDVVTHATTPERMEQWVARMEEAASDVLPREALGKLEGVVEVTAQKLRLPQSAGQGILAGLIEDGDFSRWGMANAITRASKEIEDYDLATEMERAGGLLVQMKAKDWGRIADEAMRDSKDVRVRRRS